MRAAQHNATSRQLCPRHAFDDRLLADRAVAESARPVQLEKANNFSSEPDTNAGHVFQPHLT
jgi:hypothetical protein